MERNARMLFVTNCGGLSEMLLATDFIEFTSIGSTDEQHVHHKISKVMDKHELALSSARLQIRK